MKLFRFLLFSFFVSVSFFLQAVPVTFISPDQISSGGFTISSPGLYVLTDDVVYSIASGTAITITANNVTLDLNGKTIIASNGADRGFFLSGARSNVSIRNGALNGFDSVGIRVDTGANYIELRDLKIADNAVVASIGIVFGGTSLSTVRTTNCVIDNCQTSSFGVGMIAFATDNLKISNSTFNNNIQSGINGVDCKSWEITNCQASGQGVGSTGVTAIQGFDLIDCEGIRIKDSDFCFNINPTTSFGGRGGFIRNEKVSGRGAYEIINCTFCNNGGSGVLSRGLDFTNSSSCVVKNCIFNGNSSTNANVRGLSLTGTGHYVENCIANANWTSGLGGFVASGILVTGSAHTLVNCNTSGNSSAATDGLGNGNGILMLAVAQRCLIKNCTAVSNSTVGFRDDSTAGTNLWIGNLSWGHGTSNYVGAGPGFVALAAGAQPPTGSFDERGIDNISVL